MPGRDGRGPIGHGRHRGFGQSSEGECRCPNCGHREPHQIAVPCYSRSCPKCGAPMTRV
jgi:uncharacterized protein